MYELLKKTFSNSAIYSLGNLSTKLTGFILIPFYTKHLTTSEYGVFGILEVTSTALIAIFGLQLYSAFARWYFDKEYKTLQESIFYTSTVALILVTSISAIPLLLFADHISDILFDTSEHAFIVQIMVISSMLQIVTTLPATLLRMQDKPGMFVTTNITRLVVILALTVYLLAFLQLGLKAIFIAQVAGNVVYMLMLGPYSLRNFSPDFNFRALKEMLQFSLPLLFASISSLIILLADKYILRITSGLGASGLYSFGYKIANTVYYFFVESVNLALSPIIFKLMNEQNNKRFYSKIMTYLAFVVLLLIIGISLFNREVIMLLSRNSAYHEASTIVPIIAFSALFLTMKDTSVRALSIAKKTKIISTIIIVISLLNLLLNGLLTPPFGMYGAATAFLITQIIYFLLVYRFAQKSYFIPYENRKIFVMATLSVIIIILSTLFLKEVSAVNILIKISLLGAFPFVLYFFGFYEKIELQRIKELLLRKK